MSINQVDSTNLQSTGVNRVDRENVAAEKNQTENVNSPSNAAAYQVELSKEAQEKSIREQEELESQLNAEAQEKAAQNAQQPSENTTYNNSGEIA